MGELIMLELNDSLSFLINKCNQKALSIANNYLIDLELTPAQALALHALYIKDGINQLTLGEKIQKDKTTTGNLLIKLEKSGFITREIDPEDRRSSIIYLTSKAFDIQNELKERLLKINATLSSNLTDIELQLLLSLLKKIWDE